MIDAKIYSVTIGISAFNESQNIQFLLDSINNQKKSNYILEKIIVICDGCTDNTAGKVRSYEQRFTKIELIEDSERKGKLYRLMQLYKMNTSDFIIIFDGDVVLGNSVVIEKMIESFKNETITIVGGNIRPVKAVSFFESVVSISYEFRERLFDKINDRNIIHNLHGGAMAIRKRFSQSVKFPKEIISESQFLYCSLVQQNLSYQFSRESVVFFRPPNNLHDFLLRTTRATDEKKKLERIFGSWIYDLYKIPVKEKAISLIDIFIKKPIHITLLIIIQLLSKVISTKNDSVKITGFWDTAKSTKIGIKNIHFLNEK